jgi:hypothetical protein
MKECRVGGLPAVRTIVTVCLSLEFDGLASPTSSRARNRPAACASTSEVRSDEAGKARPTGVPYGTTVAGYTMPKERDASGTTDPLPTQRRAASHPARRLPATASGAMSVENCCGSASCARRCQSRSVRCGGEAPERPNSGCLSACKSSRSATSRCGYPCQDEAIVCRLITRGG